MKNSVTYFEIQDLIIDTEKIKKDLSRSHYTWPPWKTQQGDIQDWYSLEVPSRPVIELLQQCFTEPLEEKGIFYLKVKKQSILDFHKDDNRSCTLVIPLDEGYDVDFLIDGQVRTVAYKGPTVINSSEVFHRVDNQSEQDRICLYACFYKPIEEVYNSYQAKTLLRDS
jgi:hypothetical protein